MPSQLALEPGFCPRTKPVKPTLGRFRSELRPLLLTLGLAGCGGGISERAVFSRDVMVDPCEKVDAKAGPIFEGAGWARPPEPVDCEDRGLVELSDEFDGNGNPYCERYEACGEQVRMAVFSVPFDDPEGFTRVEFTTDGDWEMVDVSGESVDHVDFEGKGNGVIEAAPWDYLELRPIE